MATPVVVGQAYRLSFTIKSYDKEGDFSDSQNSSTGNPLATIAYLNKNIRDDRVTGNGTSHLGGNRRFEFPYQFRYRFTESAGMDF